MTPQRIQLRRTKGWRKPEGAIVVARPTRWGNPYYVGLWDPEYLVTHDRVNADDPGSHIETVERAVELFRQNVLPGLPVHELAGHDLACWCPLDAPCHADALLALANQEPAIGIDLDPANRQLIDRRRDEVRRALLGQQPEIAGQLAMEIPA